jgi:ubiquinone/menaquinone biosynthesis C-methylase UbiE
MLTTRLCDTDFLKVMLNRDYNYPSSALWRAIELDLLSKLEYPANYSILDLGCGDGYVSRCLFQSKNLQVTSGIDVSKRYILKAKRNDYNPQVYKSLQVADAHNLPFKDQTFDIVFSNCVMEHIPDFQDVLCEVSRVLKSDGTFILTVPTPQFGQHSYIYQFFKKIRCRKISNLYRYLLNKRLCHYNIYNLAQWDSFLNKASLKIKSAQYYIKPETAFLCDLLEFIYTLGIWKIRLHVFLIRGGTLLEKVGIKFHKRMTIEAYYNFLKKYLYLEQADNTNDGAAILITALKSKDSQSDY